MNFISNFTHLSTDRAKNFHLLLQLRFDLLFPVDFLE